LVKLKRDYQENLEDSIDNEEFETEVRMWYLDHFLLTPFDNRYLKVPYEFMEYSYLRFMSNPGYGTIRDSYLFHKNEDKKKEKYKKELEYQREAVEGCYSKEEADNILNAFADIQNKANTGN